MAASGLGEEKGFLRIGTYDAMAILFGRLEMFDFNGDSGYWLTRLVFQRSVAFIYLIGFLIVVNQFAPLAGERGLLPAPLFLKNVRFWDSPSLFFLHYSDRFAIGLGILGIVLSMLALTGISERFGFMASILVWSLLWVIYLSFVNIGQTFYGFGWETLLLETGFLTIFLGPQHSTPPVIVIWLLRWLLFRVMLGAGMIKLRGDPCWRDLTCMYYHYETQPLPNPLSWYLHYLPSSVHRLEVLFTHFVELVVPWGYFFPGVVGWFAGFITIVFQFTLSLSGNLSWLNYITIVLCIACFDDRAFSLFLKPNQISIQPILGHQIAVVILLVGILYLSYQPLRNLFSRRQLMNASFEPLHLVNTYGAFGGITRERLEVVVEGTDEIVLTGSTKWKEYEFKGKPGQLDRTPCIVSPYHYKLDWQMWFAAMSSYWNHPWILNMVAKLLEGDPALLKLMAKNPFSEKPPKYIRLEWYRYRFTPWRESSPHWWQRERVDTYLPPLSLEDRQFQEILRQLNGSLNN